MEITMTSFGWKRKIGQTVSRDKSAAFLEDAKGDEDEEVASGTIDWLSLAPSRKVICLEDAKAKSQRLKQEGMTLAEEERWAVNFFSPCERIHKVPELSWPWGVFQKHFWAL